LRVKSCCVFAVHYHFEAKPDPPLTLVLDARYDWFSITKPAFSPRLAILYSLYEGHILRAAAGQSFRKPVWLEAQAVSEDPLLKAMFRVPLGNPDVGNELVRTAELGYRGYLTKKLRIEANLFYNQYTDFVLLQSDFTPGARRFRAENLDATFWGTGGELGDGV
jgi:outer membrane receptor protein involved in Fe transport